MSRIVQREVNSLVMEALLPVIEGARPILAADLAWSGWSCGSGRSLFDADGATGVHVEGFRGRLRFSLPYEVAREVAERHAADHPEVLARIRSEWWDEMAADARDHWDEIDEAA